MLANMRDRGEPARRGHEAVGDEAAARTQRPDAGADEGAADPVEDEVDAAGLELAHELGRAGRRGSRRASAPSARSVACLPADAAP